MYSNRLQSQSWTFHATYKELKPDQTTQPGQVKVSFHATYKELKLLFSPSVS